MKITPRLILAGTLTLGLLGMVGLLAVLPNDSAIAQAAATPTASGGAETSPTSMASPEAMTGSETPSASMVQLWDKFCVSKIPYTILALPQDATFQLASSDVATPTVAPGYLPANKTACNNVTVSRGKQVVVCRGPQLTTFTLKVSSGGNTENYQVPMGACPLPDGSIP